MAAFKLTKTEAAELDKLAQEFELAKMVLAERLDEIALVWESQYEAKSDRWKGSEPGEAAQENIDRVREWFDELPGEGEPAVNGELLR